MKQFTEKDLVEFGNQLLSKERDVLHEINLHQVTDADLEKFKEGREISKQTTEDKLNYHQLFIGKVCYLLGFEKTLELLKESKDAFKNFT